MRDVAEVSDGGEEPSQYVRYSDGKGFFPAVTIAVSKRKGTNAVTVAEDVLSRVERLRGSVIPSDVEMTVTRNYGDTAKEKSNELLYHMLIAVISVSVLIAITLGLRESLIVFIGDSRDAGADAHRLLSLRLHAEPHHALRPDLLHRHSGGRRDRGGGEHRAPLAHAGRIRRRPPFEVAVEAVDEVGNPTILATLAVVAAILPMAFVGGLMGPYMRPIPIGASAAMLFSLLVAFIVTPWAAVRILKPGGVHHAGEREDFVTRLYRRVMGTLLHRPLLRWSFLGGVVVLLLGSVSLFYFGFVKVKMLPFDNKSEFQVIVDMPNGTTLEQTARVAQLLAEETQKQQRSGEHPDLRGNGFALQLQWPGAPLLSAPRTECGRHPGESAAEGRAAICKAMRSPSRCGSACSPSPSAMARESRWPKCRPDRRCSRHWSRKYTGRRWTGGSHWRGRSAICSSRPKASWMSIGTWKTISRNTACSSTRRRPRSTAFPKTTSHARCRWPPPVIRRGCCIRTRRRKMFR